MRHSRHAERWQWRRHHRAENVTVHTGSVHQGPKTGRVLLHQRECFCVASGPVSPQRASSGISCSLGQIFPIAKGYRHPISYRKPSFYRKLECSLDSRLLRVELHGRTDPCHLYLAPSPYSALLQQAASVHSKANSMQQVPSGMGT